MVKVFLVIVLISGWHGSFHSSTEMPSMKACLNALSKVQLVIPDGDENEGVATAFCSYEDHSDFAGRWH